MKPDEHGVLKSWSTVLSNAEDYQIDLLEDICDRIESVEMPVARKGTNRWYAHTERSVIVRSRFVCGLRVVTLPCPGNCRVGRDG